VTRDLRKNESRNCFHAALRTCSVALGPRETTRVHSAAPKTYSVELYAWPKSHATWRRVITFAFVTVALHATPALEPSLQLAGTIQAIAQEADGVTTLRPKDLAEKILNDRLPPEQREKHVRDAVARAADVVRAMAGDLSENDEAEEYRRIPWIWRVSIAAGRQQDATILLPLFDASLPQAGEPLRDWQSVVLGGGIINGLSLEGRWPREVIENWLAEQPELGRRWYRTVELAKLMTDNERVRKGTRYDAQRILGVATWEETGAQLVRYLPRETDGELQMGAVSGLSDIQHPRAAAALLQNLKQLTPGNRKLAIDALLRSPERKKLLQESLGRGQVDPSWLSEEQSKRLMED
jgi:hypothetical protein